MSPASCTWIWGTFKNELHDLLCRCREWPVQLLGFVDATDEARQRRRCVFLTVGSSHLAETVQGGMRRVDSQLAVRVALAALVCSEGCGFHVLAAAAFLLVGLALTTFSADE